MTAEVVDFPLPSAQTVVEWLHSYAARAREGHNWPIALSAIRRAIEMDPKNSNLWATLGCALLNSGNFDAALMPMRTAIHLAPEVAANYGNLALLYCAFRAYEEAEENFALAIEKSTAEEDRLKAIWDRSLLRLSLGDWERGLEEYESRIPLNGKDRYPGMPMPMWQGEDLSGKTLYIQAEQGIGDRILLSRYFTYLKAKWPTCSLKACFNEKLANLFWEFRDIVEFLPTGAPWPEEPWDYGTYAASLPFLCGTRPDTIPSDPGLLKKRVEREFSRGIFHCPSPNLPSLKVGIAWTGNPNQSRNHERSVPLELMLTLAEDPRITLYSFQVGSDDVSRLGAEGLVCDLGPTLEKEGLVAAGVAMMDMDLIISVCTSTAHLAGALSLPVWTLLCWDPYWVWMQGPSTPFYPSMKLFRQSSPGNWKIVIANVREELSALATERGFVSRVA